MHEPSTFRTKIFADGADRDRLVQLTRHRWIAGFTTNPTLMRKAGVRDYERFAREAVDLVEGRPISFEVFSDDFGEMEAQARKIASFADNVYVKIPVTNTHGESSEVVVRRLGAAGVKINVTALMTPRQVREVTDWLAGGPPAYASLFAGRVADTGRDPLPIMAAAVELVRVHPNVELIWASPREVLNVVQADSIGCHVITLTHDLLEKIPLLGRDLDEFSLETVRMFFRDGREAGYSLETGEWSGRPRAGEALTPRA